AQKVLVDRAKANPKIEFILDTVVESIEGDPKITGAVLRNVKTGDTRELPLGGLFVYIGNVPNTSIFHQCVDLDANGYIEVDANMATSCPGLFVAGDVRKSPLKQIVTAGSDGSIAALTADKYLDDLAAGTPAGEAEAAATAPSSWQNSY
ncbi:MAG: NAD(P)/FAD-dependent oxidoreductase, partial [Chloroflexota bacterium]